MTQRLSKAEQAGGQHEAYETPAWCVRRLLEAAPLPSGKWLEPCAGSGNIIRAVRDIAGYADVSWTACEIREECGDPLVDAGVVCDNVLVGDFFGYEETLRQEADGRRWAFDVVGPTNPPFSRAAEFIEAGRRLAPIVVMLLPVPFFGSEDREDLFARHMPSMILQLPNRPQFSGAKGTNSVEYGWWIWEASRRQQRGTWLERLAITPAEERGKRARKVAS